MLHMNSFYVCDFKSAHIYASDHKNEYSSLQRTIRKSIETLKNALKKSLD